MPDSREPLISSPLVGRAVINIDHGWRRLCCLPDAGEAVEVRVDGHHRNHVYSGRYLTENGDDSRRGSGRPTDSCFAVVR